MSVTIEITSPILVTATGADIIPNATTDFCCPYEVLSLMSATAVPKTNKEASKQAKQKTPGPRGVHKTHNFSIILLFLFVLREAMEAVITFEVEDTQSIIRQVRTGCSQTSLTIQTRVP